MISVQEFLIRTRLEHACWRPGSKPAGSFRADGAGADVLRRRSRRAQLIRDCGRTSASMMKASRSSSTSSIRCMACGRSMQGLLEEMRGHGRRADQG